MRPILGPYGVDFRNAVRVRIGRGVDSGEEEVMGCVVHRTMGVS